MPAVGQNFQPQGRLFYNQFQPALLQPLAVFPCGLGQKHLGMTGGKVYLQAAGAGFGSFQKVFQQPVQSASLPVQHLGIFSNFFTAGRLLADQVGIVNQRGERGFNIVGDIGDQFCFQPFAFQPLFHRQVGAAGNAVQVAAVLRKACGHTGGVHLAAKVPLGHVLPGFLQPAQAKYKVKQQNRKQCRTNHPGQKPEKQRISRKGKQKGEKIYPGKKHQKQQRLP